MKKTLVVLLILAVAGGVFAQEFSWSGGVDINGKIDFLNTDFFNHQAIIGQDGDGSTAGHVDLEYTNGGLTLGVGFSAKYWDADDGLIEDATIGLSAGYVGENFGLHVEMDLLGTASFTSAGPTSLWGYYTFMDEALRFDVAYKGGGNGNWVVSDLVLEEFTDGKANATGIKDMGLWNWDRLDGAGGFQVTYTGIEGLSFGVQLPFDFDEIVSGTTNKTFGGYFILSSLWGVKYDVDPLSLSFMLNLNPKVEPIPPHDLEGIYVDIHFGFGYKLNDAMAIKGDVALASFADEFFAAAGLQFDYEAAPLNAGIKVIFHDFTDKNGLNADWYGFGLEINPYVGYWFIEDVLKGNLGLTFKQGLGDYNDTLSVLEISPGIEYNVDPNAKITLGYTMGFDLDLSEIATNAITLGFSWSF